MDLEALTTFLKTEFTRLWIWFWLVVYCYQGDLALTFLVGSFTIIPVGVLITSPNLWIKFHKRVRDGILVAVFVAGGLLAGLVIKKVGAETPGATLEKPNYKNEIFVLLFKNGEKTKNYRVPAEISRKTFLAPFIYLLPSMGGPTGEYSLERVKFPGIGWVPVYCESEFSLFEPFAIAANDDHDLGVWTVMLTRSAVPD